MKKGIDFKQKMIKLDDDNDDGDENLIKLQLWDTAGQERFRALTTAYYRGAMGIIVVYDVTNLESFQHVQYWFKNIDEVSLNKQIFYLAFLVNK